ncbi:protein kinase domain-containing protein [Sorangium sp. So ce542]|uniref:protein kinase domain-containing protein n=1 Tax=Sorangium sp. So ce542 TaxID=3133316 RepID=UPI003F605C02
MAAICLDDNDVTMFVEGRGGDAWRRRVEGHLDACAPCRALVSEVVRRDVDASGEDALAPSPIPARIGRYKIVETLGVGSYGIVIAAHDPELDRLVAIKILRSDRANEASAAHVRDRLVREAKAMARVSHPNVVAVHDVGVTGDSGVYLAMELVDGATLRAWLAERARGFAEIRRVFIDAGRGLAAAHRQGLVHRDFKPENVLVGRDGRARVTDFGLAGVDACPHVGRAPGAHRRLDRSLTRSGLVVGTPVYMAPEQHRGAAVDARADQFSFCVALYEALYGERPFDGTTYEELRANVRRGALRTPKRAPRVPAAVWAVLRRGLSPAPEARFESMDQLLDALSASRPRSWRAALLGVTLFAAAWLAWEAAAPPQLAAPSPVEPAAEACTNGADEDGDRLIDCDDPDCTSHDACAWKKRGCVAPPRPSRSTIAVARAHTCSIERGALFCWGAPWDPASRVADGRLGVSAPVEDPVTSPLRVGAKRDWESISAGGGHTCAIDASGALYCWGRNADGELGVGDTAHRLEPTRVGGGSAWLVVSAGDAHTCAIDQGDELYCWGRRDDGRLGDGAVGGAPRTAPTNVRGPRRRWRDVAAARDHTCAVDDSGALYCWGDMANGKIGAASGCLGDSDHDIPDSPAGLRCRSEPSHAFPQECWTSVAASADFTCAIDGEQHAQCWGDDSEGQLGRGVTGPCTVRLRGHFWHFVSLSAGRRHACGIAAERSRMPQLVCWGQGNRGQLGLDPRSLIKDPSSEKRLLVDKDVGWAAEDGWTEVAAGELRSCARADTGTLYCAGENTYGECGHDSRGEDVTEWQPVIFPET